VLWGSDVASNNRLGRWFLGSVCSWQKGYRIAPPKDELARQTGEARSQKCYLVNVQELDVT